MKRELSYSGRASVVSPLATAALIAGWAGAMAPVGVISTGECRLIRRGEPVPVKDEVKGKRARRRERGRLRELKGGA